MATYTGAVTHLIEPQPTRYDYFAGVGDGYVSGTIKTKSTPADIPTLALVRLVRDQDGLLIQAQWTNPTTGAYRFDNLSLDYQYTVTAFDPAKNYRAVIADNITPKVAS